MFAQKIKTPTIAHLVLIVCLMTLGSYTQADPDVAYRGEIGSFTNDFFGDGHDRWRSGSYQRSYYTEGSHFTWMDGLELRARSEIVTPWVNSKQPTGDRAYSTVIGVGAFAHKRLWGFDTRGGGEVLLLGDGTGLEHLQRGVHDGLNLDNSFDPSRSDFNRLDNGITYRFDIETARIIPIGKNGMIRPYTGLTFGADQAAVLGADLVLGHLASADTWTRDIVTGRLLTPQVDQIQGLSFVAGWDVRAVDASVHLPDDGFLEIQPTQYRSRVGVQTSNDLINIFLGQAWLSSEFIGQAETQRVGMLSISFSF